VPLAKAEGVPHVHVPTAEDMRRVIGDSLHNVIRRVAAWSRVKAAKRTRTTTSTAGGARSKSRSASVGAPKSATIFSLPRRRPLWHARQPRAWFAIGPRFGGWVSGRDAKGRVQQRFEDHVIAELGELAVETEITALERSPKTSQKLPPKELAEDSHR